MKKDAIRFFKLIGFIEICDETDLSAGPKDAIDVYNDTVVKTEELAKKYGLYDEHQACNDVWYHLYTLWPQMKEFFLKQLGDDTMKELNIQDLKEADYNAIEDHLSENGVFGWLWDKDLQKWFYNPTGQTISEYILENIETILSPYMLKNYMEILLFSKHLDHVLVNLTDMQLLTTLSSKERKGDLYQVQIIGETIDITPKQWRSIVNEAVERIMRRDK